MGTTDGRRTQHDRFNIGVLPKNEDHEGEESEEEEKPGKHETSVAHTCKSAYLAPQSGIFGSNLTRQFFHAILNT